MSALALAGACGGSDAIGAKPEPKNSITSTGGTAASTDAKVTLSFPPGAVAAPIAVTIVPTTTGNENVVAGSAYEFGPDGTTFAQPVALSLAYDATSLPTGMPASALHVAKRVGTDWVAISEGLSIDSTNGRVRASIRSFSSYAVVADPCASRAVDLSPPLTGNPPQMNGGISPSDCLRSPGRRADAYRLPPTPFVMGSGSGTNFILKEATGSATTGRVYFTFPKSKKAWYLVVSPTKRVEIVAVGDSGAVGDQYVFNYDTASARQLPGAFSCDDYAPLLFAGSVLTDAINTFSACKYTVKFSPFPSAIGQPLLARLFLAPLDAGKTYTVTIDSFRAGTNSQFDASLTVFQAGAVVAQQVTQAGAFGTSRTVTFTAAVSANYLIEVASGQPATANGQGWITPTGEFRLRIAGP